MSVVFHLIMTSNFRNSIGLSAHGRKKSHVPVYFLFRKSIAYCNKVKTCQIISLYKFIISLVSL